MIVYEPTRPPPVLVAAGAGACLISDAWAGIELSSKRGREVRVGRDGEVASRLVELDPRADRSIGVPGVRKPEEDLRVAQLPGAPLPRKVLGK